MFPTLLPSKVTFITLAMQLLLPSSCSPLVCSNIRNIFAGYTFFKFQNIFEEKSFEEKKRQTKIRIGHDFYVFKWLFISFTVVLVNMRMRRVVFFYFIHWVFSVFRSQLFCLWWRKNTHFDWFLPTLIWNCWI